jgi:hypothetical protein
VLEDEAARVGIGEASPLPGFSPRDDGAGRDVLLGMVGKALPDYTPQDVRTALSDAA